ncbi:hypothetical protein IJ00_09310 [Calothrix sp. 336/3]|nr:hypothetical protein IJ00_09310 [Calothrix sp. 336/3]
MSPDGKKIATSGSDGTVKVWNTFGQKLSEFKADKDGVNSVIFSPDGRNLITVGEESIAKIWDLSGKLLTEFNHDQKVITSVSFSPNGKLLATASRDSAVKIWTISGQQLQKIQAHKFVNCVKFSPDGQSIVTAGIDDSQFISQRDSSNNKNKSYARLWNLSGQKIAEFHGYEDEESINSVSFSPDSKHLATASDNGTIRLWDLDSNKLVESYNGQQGAIINIGFSSDGKYLATAGEQGSINILRIEKDIPQSRTSKPSKETNNQAKDLFNINIVEIPSSPFRHLKEIKGHKGAVNSLGFSPKGEFLVTAGDDGIVRLWAMPNNKESQLEKKQAGGYWVTFSPDGKLLVTSGNNGVKIWDLSGRLLAELKHQDAIWSVVFSPDGRHLITVGKDGFIRIWNLSGQLLAQWKGHKDRITWVSISSDGKNIATASKDSTAKLWNLSGQLLAEFKGHKGGVSFIDFTPDSKSIITTGEDAFVRILKLSGEQVSQFNSDQVTINSASISPDGKSIATVGKDTRIWDFSGKQLVVLDQSSIFSNNFVPDGQRSTQGQVFSSSFSPDGQFIATGGRGIIQLWHVTGGQLAEYTIPEEEAINGISFSPDGKLITAIGSGGTVRVWRLEGLDDLLTRGCHWLKDYFVTRPELRKEICPEQIPEVTK